MVECALVTSLSGFPVNIMQEMQGHREHYNIIFEPEGEVTSIVHEVYLFEKYNNIVQCVLCTYLPTNMYTI